jgi:methylmalonyl-CoA mutase
LPKEVIRATEEEKQYQIRMLDNLHDSNADKTENAIRQVQEAAIQNRNMFEQLMETCKYASLGQITKALFEVGGQYRRNM